jgi:hypothetical protein
MVVFLILSFLDILEDFLRALISVSSIRLLLISVSLHVNQEIQCVFYIPVLDVG